MTSRPKVALVTCAEMSQYDEDAPDLLAALAAESVAAESMDWDDPTVDWAGYDLVVIRSTWDYATRRDEFVAWARRVPHLLNPADIIEWNTHKGYLAELDNAGVPVVPTTFATPDDPVDLPTAGEYVIKPAVGAGARDTARYTGAQATEATSHLARLHHAGHTAMIQPYLTGVDVHGETSLLYLGGVYSHSIRKDAVLADGAGAVEGIYHTPAISLRSPEPAEWAVAEQGLEAVPGGPSRLLYARIDLVPGPAGAPVLLELELTEPSLFLTHSPGAAQRFAAAIAAAADRASAVTP